MNSPSYIGFASAKPFQTIVIAALVGSLLGAALAMAAPPRVKASLSFSVTQQARQETADYAYDGYYAIRAAELVSDTIISWLSTPSVIKEIHAAAGDDMSEEEALAAAGKEFRSKKYSSQNVVVTFSAPDEAAALSLASAASDVLAARSARLVLSSSGDTLFHVTASSPVVARASTPPRAAAAAGAFVGAFLGLALAYAARAKKDPQP
ncbi:MAG TPA: hypothetical protein VL283_03650 [Candidatus Baltobacteraceae bacterium]|nr:hypothetical protein [Candidatus Baltobacteraceae bacterium]